MVDAGADATFIGNVMPKLTGLSRLRIVDTFMSYTHAARVGPTRNKGDTDGC
jgi:hypothetical protein